MDVERTKRDFMIVDVDTCAWEDIMAGLLKSKRRRT